MKPQKEHVNKEINRFSNILFEMQKKENNGSGITCVRGAEKLLKSGNVEGAKVYLELESDKLREYPEIQEYIFKTWKKIFNKEIHIFNNF